MKKALFQFIALLATINVCAQNVGINTTTPGSTLSINGSMGAGYKAVTTNYTLTATDYVVVYNGTANGTFTLPPAMPAGSGNFKGRVYRIKNNTNFQLNVSAAANEQINVELTVLVGKGKTLELISTGLTAGNTWEKLSGLIAGGMGKALEYGWYSRCAGYDLAAVITRVQIQAQHIQCFGTALRVSLPVEPRPVSITHAFWVRSRQAV